MLKRLKKSFCVVLLFFFILILSVQNSRAYSTYPDEDFDTDKYFSAETTKEVIDILMKARATHQETVVIRANPSKVTIENPKEGWIDLDSSIYNYFHYGYCGGLFNAMDYDVFSGPGCEGRKADKSAEGYNFYKIVFTYHDNDDELAKADQKLKQIMADSKATTDAEKLKYLYQWMKQNVPEGKDSETGYPRNCNGIYGCLFGDGTGYCCSTYACTIQRFCELTGINSYIIGGAYMYGEVSHAFNVVELNEKWYVIDYAFDDFLEGMDSINSSSTHKELINKYMPGYTFAKEDFFPKERIPITEDMVTLEKTEYTYCDDPINPKVNVTMNGNSLTAYSDYTLTYSNNYNAGFALVTVTGINDYTGSVTKEFKIVPKSLDNVIVSMPKTLFICNGKPIEPILILTDTNNCLLSLDKDYLLSYTNNVDVGTATVIATGCGNYTGTISRNFTICEDPSAKSESESESKELSEEKTEQIDKKQKSSSITKLDSGKKSVKISWKKQSKDIKGYEIQYSLDKKFKKNVKTISVNSEKVTSKNIKKLKSGKKYYIRIRTFKKSGKNKIYSKWSSAKSVKVL
ncbi:fibronectin type III domain-containing protein [Butyrivibrio sp. AE3004]|uniref:fibronectin type III domain-containing protein n=1 Tax=Butyrivibrio sp. AE3004 TaxID=1506994 RepID=UPI000493E9A7|nr:fibronectin type III domain-containing protein [Butyrivibrio sp. AE3004]